MKNHFSIFLLSLFLLFSQAQAQLVASKFFFELGGSLYQTNFANYNHQINFALTDAGVDSLAFNNYPFNQASRIAIGYKINDRIQISLAMNNTFENWNTVTFVNLSSKDGDTFTWDQSFFGDTVTGNYQGSFFRAFREIKVLSLQGNYKVLGGKRHQLQAIMGISYLRFNYSLDVSNLYSNGVFDRTTPDVRHRGRERGKTASLQTGLRYDLALNRFFGFYSQAVYSQTFTSFRPLLDKTYANFQLQAGLKVTLPAVELKRMDN
ncbi:MAG: hypothetical protein MRZ79_04865 [Bacteroidia bacterium]|nr:hypothetical protein [Bacteroidia bacterium]